MVKSLKVIVKSNFEVFHQFQKNSFRFPFLGLLCCSILVFTVWVGILVGQFTRGNRKEDAGMQSSRNLFSEGMKNWSVWLREDNVIYSSDSDEGRDGFTSDPASAVSFLKTDGKSTLRLSGEWSGGVTTKESFSNYHLSIYYRWGEKVWERTEHERQEISGF